MHTMNLTHTSSLVPAYKRSTDRSVFQSRSAVSVSRRTVGGVRAKSDNTGPSITNSGKTEKPDSYQVIEAPVRNNNSADKSYAYGGKDISERQSDIDRSLVDGDQPKEQGILHTKVAFPDALRFKGAAPEIVNSRLAMLGFVAALAAEFATDKNIFEQVQAYPQTIASTFIVWIVASLVPILKGVPRKGNSVFSSGRELVNGRIAMLGFVALIATEYFNGGQSIAHFYHLK